MVPATETPTGIVRTSRGLSIAGTRITLYSIMDYLKADWPTHLIRDRLHLTDDQMDAVVAYLDDHREEVEQEYALVLRQAEVNQRYWQERNRERFAEIAKQERPPEQQAIWEKIQAKKKQRNIA